jgi:hypothetical protein
MSLISARSISLDSTFKHTITKIFFNTSGRYYCLYDGARRPNQVYDLAVQGMYNVHACLLASPLSLGAAKAGSPLLAFILTSKTSPSVPLDRPQSRQSAKLFLPSSELGNWDSFTPFPQASVPLPPGHILLGVRGWGVSVPTTGEKA